MIIEGKEYLKPLFVFALPNEEGGFFDNVDKLFVGLGKVQSAYHLTRTLALDRSIDIVVNLGTAGSPLFKKGTVVNCSKFVQRDMDVRGLGYPLYHTPFSDEETILEYGITMSGVPQATLGSGDQFATSIDEESFHVVDMEAYALAHVCKNEGIPFLCLKYISDGADDNAANDWTTEVTRSAIALKNILFNNI